MFVRVLLIAGLAVLVWSAVARSSQAHGAKQVVTVRPYDTLWSIAQRHYGGDVRDAIWRIERANHLHGRRRARGADARPAVGLVDPALRPRSDDNRRVDLDLVFLGTSGSAPTASRAPTALLVRRGGDRLLFDCGEGTQRQLMRSTVGLPDLEEIFMTHFHGDHYLGLPGMLKTFQLRQRERAADGLRPARPRRSLRRACGACSESSRTRSSSSRCVPGRRSSATSTASSSFPVDHGVSSVGYALDEDERPGRFDNEAADALGDSRSGRSEVRCSAASR